MCYLAFSEFFFLIDSHFHLVSSPFHLKLSQHLLLYRCADNKFSWVLPFLFHLFLKTIFHYKSFQIYKKVEKMHTIYSLPKFYHSHLIITVLLQIYHPSISLSIIYLIFYANELKKSVNFTLNTLACEL